VASLVPENPIDQKALWDMVSTPTFDRYFYLLDLPQPVKVGYGTTLDCQDDFSSSGMMRFAYSNLSEVHF